MPEPICKIAYLAERRIVRARIGRAPVIVSLVGGRPVAVAARCPHQGADLGAGTVVDRVDWDARGCLSVDPTRPVLRCPWHGFEYDLATGEPVVESPGHRRLRLRTFRLAIDGEDVVTA